MPPALREGMKTIITTLVLSYSLLIALLAVTPTASFVQKPTPKNDDSITVSCVFRANLNTIHNKLSKKKVRFV
jgi:hypothetical protein